MKKQTLALLAAFVTVYHLAALIKDAEQWEINARRARADPSLDNLTQLLMASGIMIAAARTI